MRARPWFKVLTGASGVVAVSLSLSAMADGGGLRANVIYGDDNRLDLYQVQVSQQVELADSTVALVQGRNLVRDGEKFKISSTPIGTELGLCADEPFREQPSAAFCSGFLVGEDLMLTAGHCIKSASDCANTKFVFGFSVNREGEFPSHADGDQIVGCKEIVAHKFERLGADYSLVRLDRKVTNHRPLPLSRDNSLRNGDAIGVIGHPSGLPTKVAFGAKVRSVAAPGYFVANLDTYGGNSGSAVFNERTGAVEGILVRGEQDYEYDSERGCSKSKLCEENGCRGEDVTKISAIMNEIPSL